MFYQYRRNLDFKTMSHFLLTMERGRLMGMRERLHEAMNLGEIKH